MKKLSMLGILILVAMFSFNVKADIITLDGANEIANAFFANSASSQKRALKSAAQLEYAWDSNSLTQTGSSMMKSVEEDPTFYVFNNPDGEGFVIVSGDSNARSVIGYSYEGSVPMADEIPDPMKDYLLGIDEEIKWARTNLTSTGKNLKATLAETGEDREVYLPTPSWDQHEPFNGQCYTNATSSNIGITGCVPIAYAMIMKYHNWPEVGTLGYTNEGGRYELANMYTGVAISNRTYDWNKILFSYSGDYTQEQADEVAKLVSHIGHAFSTDHNKGTSNEGASTKWLNYFFGYNWVDASQQSNFTLEVWKGKIRESLNNGCPIPYAADRSSDSGDLRHMFVLDGYKDIEDVYHFNWGWRGSANGWFSMTAMTSDGRDYSWKDGSDHTAFFNFRPDKTTYPVTATANPSSMGTVSVNMGTAGSTASAEMIDGATATLTAYPADGYALASWTKNGVVVGSKNTIEVKVGTSDNDYVANFDLASNVLVTKDYTIKPSTVGLTGSSKVGVVTYQTSEGYPAALSLASTKTDGTSISAMSRNDDEQIKLYAYDQATSSTSVKYTISVPEGYIITEYSFEYSLNLPTYPCSINYSGGTISSPADKGWHSLSPVSVNAQTAEFTITAEKAHASSSFYIKNFNVTVAKEGGVTPVTKYTAIAATNGTGGTATVAVGTGTGAQSQSVTPGTTVTFLATPANTNYTFVGWMFNGAVESKENPYNVTINSDVTYTAKFVPTTDIVNSIVIVAGCLDGSMGEEELENNCTVASNVQTSVVGDQIVLTATTNPGYVFNGWGWDGETFPYKDKEYTLTIPSEYVYEGVLCIFASFSKDDTPVTPQYTATAVASPTEGGTATVAVEGTNVVFTAEPATDYEFVNWTGTGTSTWGENPLTLPLIADITLTANFREKQGGGDTGDTPLDRTGWTVTASSQEATGEGAGNGVASCIVDNNFNTYWHSDWKTTNPTYPHWFMIDMQSVKSINAFEYVSRGTGTNSDAENNGNILNYTLYVSETEIDPNNRPEQPTVAGYFTYNSTTNLHKVELGEAVTGRYIMLYATGNSSANGLQYASCVEFYVYGEQAEVDEYPQLTNVPTIYINTENGVGVTSKDDYVNAYVTVRGAENEEDNITEVLTEIKGRGNSTWEMEKKPYRLKFNQKINFLGNDAKEKNWVLLANYADKTLMRNALAFETARDKFDFGFTPSVTFVDVVLNSEYIGSYMVTDQVEVKKNRVPVTEQETTAQATDPAITGGYLIEVDGFADSEISWFKTTKGMKVTIKYPKDDEINSDQTAYIKNYTQQMEDALFGTNYTNAETGWRKYIDEASMVDWYIACELFGNSDAWWSTYMYKERDDVFKFGPLWDFDIAFNNDDRLGDATQKLMRTYAHDPKTWIARWWEDEGFQASVKARWAELRENGILDYMTTYIDETEEYLSESQTKNFQRWNILNTKVYRELEARGSYAAEVAFLKNYVTSRINYLDTKFSLDLEYITDFGTSTNADKGALTAINFNIGSKVQTLQTGKTSSSGAIYVDKLSEVITIKAGTQVTSLTTTGSVGNDWMHGYLFVDWNNDKTFTPDLNEWVPTEESELIAYGFWSGQDGDLKHGGVDDNTGYNHLGNQVSDSTTPDRSTNGALEAFTIPSDIPAGDYRARYKLDWNCTNPDAVLDTDMGAMVVDFTLRIEEPSETPEDIYEEMCKPTFSRNPTTKDTDNNTNISAAVINGKSITLPEVTKNSMDRGAIQVGYTDIIEVYKGERVLDLTFEQNWNDITIYQIVNGNTDVEPLYGPYDGSWSETGNHGQPFVEMANDGIEVDGTRALFPITFRNVGDFVVVRVAVGDVTTPCAVTNYGGYVDFLFKVIEPPVRTVTVASSDIVKGSVSITSPEQEGLSVTTNEDVTVLADANDEYRFVNWTIDSKVVGTEATYTYKGTEDATITANFAEYVVEPKKFDRTGWTVTASSEETVGETAPDDYIIDNSTATFWHSKWKNGEAGYPHWFMIDMKSVKSINAFDYVSRGTGTTEAAENNGNIKNYTLYVSETEINVNSLPSAAVSGTFSYPSASNVHNVKLTTPVIGRYVMLYATGQSANGRVNASCADFQIYGKDVYSVSATATPQTGGTATVTPNKVAEGDVATFTATVNAGYKFLGWFNGDTKVSEDAEYAPRISGNLSLTAKFEEIPAITPVAALTDMVQYQRNHIDLIHDNSLTTKFWSNTAQQEGQYITLELGGLYEVEDIVLYFASGDRPGAVKIEISTNGSDWNDVSTFNSSDIPAGEGASYGCTAEGAEARFVKMTITSPNGDKWLQLLEFKVYGTEVVDVPEYAVSVEPNNQGWGTVSIQGYDDTSISIEEGLTLTLLAEPEDDYLFVNWTVNDVEVSHEATFKTEPIFEATTYVANFKEKTRYNVTANATEGGTAEVSQSSVLPGNQVTFTATPADGYQFVNWTESGVEVSTENPYTVTITAEKELTANFEAIPVPTYNVNISVNGNGRVEKSVESVEEGGEVTLTAIAEDGYEFTKWSDESTENPRTITSVTADIELTAYFEVSKLTVTVSSADENMGSVTASATEVEYDDRVKVTATANDGYYFVKWTDVDGNLISESFSYTFVVTESVELIAHFAPLASGERTIKTASNDDSKGYVIIGMSMDKNPSVTTADPVELYAATQQGCVFMNWTIDGVVVSTSQNYTYTRKKSVTLQANFNSPELQLPSGYPVVNKITTSCGNAFTESNKSADSHALHSLTATTEIKGIRYEIELDKSSHTFNNFTDTKIMNVKQGGTLTINFTVGIHTNNIWFGFDWNRDGKFDEVIAGFEESKPSGTTEGSISVTIPEDALPGKSVMRIISDGIVCESAWNVTTPMAGTHGKGVVGYAGSLHDITLFVNNVIKSEVNLTNIQAQEENVLVTTQSPAEIVVGSETYKTTEDNLTATIPVSEGDVKIVVRGSNIVNVDCGNTLPTTHILPVKELVLRNTSAAEVAIDAPVLEKITVVSDENNNVAAVSVASDLSQGVQVVVEKTIKTPVTKADGTTPTIFNFLSMPFAFNTADIKYWDGDSWETATPEVHIRILMYDSEVRAEQDYENTWHTFQSTESMEIPANQGFVIVGSKSIGKNQGDVMKLQFTSAEAAYNGSVNTVTAKAYRKESGETHPYDTDWNINGVPYLTNGLIDGYTLYFHNGYGYEAVATDHALESEKVISAYQSVMYQANIESGSKEIYITPSSVSRITKAADDVFARAYISVDDAAPAKIILSDESSENFVVNEDAWYLAPTANAEPAAYFNIGGSDAAVTVQPEAAELPMTVYTGAGTQHRIALSATDGEYEVYLKDAVTDEIVCLNDEDYNFTAAAKTTIANRFTVSMVEPTGIIEQAKAEGAIKAVVAGDVIKLYGTEEGDEVTLYTTGGMVITNAVAEDGVTTIETSATGVLIIKVAGQTVKVVK